MDRAIFTSPNTVFSFYLHCTDTQRNTRTTALPCSSSLSFTGVRTTWPTSTTTDLTVIARKRTQTLAHAHTHTYRVLL